MHVQQGQSDSDGAADHDVRVSPASLLLCAATAAGILRPATGRLLISVSISPKPHCTLNAVFYCRHHAHAAACSIALQCSTGTAAGDILPAMQYPSPFLPILHWWRT